VLLHGEGAASAYWLLLAACRCYRQEFDAVQDILQQLLQPRLLACLSSLLSSSTDPTAIQAKLDILLQPTTTPAHTSEQQGQHQQQPLKAHVMVVLDLLQSVLSGWPAEVVASSCTRLCTWTIVTTGQDLCLSLLAGSGPAGGASGVEGGAEESGAVSAALELMQGVLHGCLVVVVAAWAGLQESQQQQQQQQQVVLDLLAAVNRLGESPAAPDMDAATPALLHFQRSHGCWAMVACHKR